MPLNNDDIQQLISILQRGLTTEESSAAQPTKKRGRPKAAPKTKAVKSTKTKTTKTRTAKSSKGKSSKAKPSNNLFDSMPEKNAERNPKDKLLYKIPPSPRVRKSNIIEVRCRSCGDKSKISADLVLDKARYKCNKCAMSPG